MLLDVMVHVYILEFRNSASESGAKSHTIITFSGSVQLGNKFLSFSCSCFCLPCFGFWTAAMYHEFD